ncbi:MAG: NADH-quinone oxidoreductase subunit J [Actinobacteria bacterium]|nr:NADH-quinone oxidoreductase subunit J [Actinomycetota bacterium]MUH44765.1 NADH-quinone oxidoreductase subunit J [Actinomycetota bacterium]
MGRLAPGRRRTHLCMDARNRAIGRRKLRGRCWLERRIGLRRACARTAERIMELFVFVCASIMILVGAIGVVVRKHPVHAALSLVLTLFGIAVLFVAQEAEFLAAVQVIVYAGAIVVLFLFVIMLLGVDRVEELRTEPIAGQRWIAAFVGVAMLGLLVAAIVTGAEAVIGRGDGIASNIAGDNSDANVAQLANSVFSDYVLAFELTSVLLVIAVVGTVLLARKRKGQRVVAP